MRLHLVHDQLRRLPLVEALREALGDPLERAGEVRLLEEVAHLVGRSLAGELGDGGGVALHAGEDTAERAGEAVRDHEAVAGDRDRRREEPLPRQLAAVRPREVQAGHGAGDAHRHVAVVVALLAVLAVDEEHRGGGGHRRALAEVVHRGLARRRAGRGGTRRRRCSPPPGGRPRARTRWPPPRRRRCRRPSGPRRRPARRSRSARRPCRAGRGRARSRRGSRPGRRAEGRG